MMDWAARRMEVSAPLTAEKRDAYHLARIRETVAHARRESPFYRTRRKWPDALPESLADVARLPFTWPQELARNDPPFTAAPRSAIARMVTLQTSGTSGQAKRIAFTAQDVEDTIDYFHHGMAQFARPGDRVGIVFPAERPGSIGEDLVEATRRLDATPLTAPLADLSAASLLGWIRSETPDVLFGPPVPFLAAARLSHADGGPVPAIRAALISSDAACAALIAGLNTLWGCEVFDHWGMTESGYGGALDCPHHAGAHIRETDLYVEVIDPLSGTSVQPGEEGEIVLTTLRRTALPLIRYRTGDLARMIDTPCRCGSPFRRLVGLGGRIGGGASLRGAESLSRAAMDQALFAVSSVTDYTARLEDGPPAVLDVVVAAPPVQHTADIEATARRALLAMPAIGRAVGAGELDLNVTRAAGALLPHAGKRGITHACRGAWPRAVLFDLDGTLAHTLPAVVAALNETLAAFGKAPLAADTVAGIIGGGARMLMERAARHLGQTLSPDEQDAMVARYVSLYHVHETALSALHRGAREVVQSLARENRKVAVVTNKRTRDAEILLDRLALAPWVNVVLGGGEAGLCNKPDPDLLLLACRRLNCETGDALFVGDGAEDLAAARAIAMPFVFVERNGRRLSEGQPDRVITELTDLSPLLFEGAPTC
ncbi:2-phosphoglycolate phosphatase [Breoghania corrubedonensis]|uniref:2-phosphoglycolate phosphatase n=1 Tax=Breoghania corrubedonensis TaxID=665038 RepID=A0A2T5VGK3_9HYPH|nr:HAD-IA family hydrolase [Breoghania corrubedonensis]PTW62846.1 2-phosphoglycolate phosphatase [Breoghania corrubedonensis]